MQNYCEEFTSDVVLQIFWDDLYEANDQLTWEAGSLVEAVFWELLSFVGH